MAQEERSTIVSMLTNILVNLYITLRLHGLWQAGALDGPDALQIFARAVLWAIPLSIVGMIVLTILFTILVAIVTRDPDPESIKDERDHVFEMRGMGATMALVALGFVASLVALALGYSALAVFVMVYYSFAVGSFLGDLVKFLSYRHGG